MLRIDSGTQSLVANAESAAVLALFYLAIFAPGGWAHTMTYPEPEI